MKSSLLFVALAALAVLLFFGLFFAASGTLTSQSKAPATSAPDSELIGARAPYIDLPDTSGNHVRLDDFAGMPLVVVFWSTWNADASDQIHILDQFLSSGSADSKLVKVIAIDSQEDRSVVASFMRRGGYQVPVLVDAQGAVSDAYGIKSLPTAYFIGRDGVIRDVHAGVLSGKSLVDNVESLIQ